MPGNDEHPFAGHLNKACVIGHRTAICTSMSRLEQPTVEALRSLDSSKGVSVHSDDDETCIVDTLDRVDNRHARNDCRVASMDSSRDSDHELGWNKGPCGVVHEHNLDVVRQREQRQRHGCLTGFTTGHDHDLRCQIGFVEHDAHLIDLIGRYCQHDETNRMRRAQCPNRMDEKRGSTEEPECLRSTRPKSVTATGRRNDGRGSPLGGHVGLGGEDLVEDCLGFVLVGLLGEGKFAHENLAGLGEHALFSRG